MPDEVETPPAGRARRVTSRGLVRVETEWKAAQSAHERRIAASQTAGILLPLEVAAEKNGLDAFEKDVLLLALAPSFDPAFAREIESAGHYYTLSVRDYLALLCDRSADSVAARRRFGVKAPLFARGLLSYYRAPDEGGSEQEFLDASPELPHKVAGLLLGTARDEPAPRLSPVAGETPERGDGEKASAVGNGTPETRLADVVLPAATRRQLQGLVDAARARTKVYDDWGLGGKLKLGRGVTALFSGPSGVGKTMSAAAVAGELGLPLRVVNLAQVQSKYFGKTEKHLEREFEEAREAGAVLFFDEADALFGHRLNGGHRHAQFRNNQINFLLTTLERHEGVVILTTNLPENLDPAFERRLRYRVAFAPPDAEAREALWRAMVSPKTPLADDVDFAALAWRYAFTGGTIRNVLLRAAFAAAAAGGVLTAEHLEVAAREEKPLEGEPSRRMGFACPKPGVDR